MVARMAVRFFLEGEATYACAAFVRSIKVPASRLRAKHANDFDCRQRADAYRSSRGDHWKGVPGMFRFSPHDIRAPRPHGPTDEAHAGNSQTHDGTGGIA